MVDQACRWVLLVVVEDGEEGRPEGEGLALVAVGEVQALGRAEEGEGREGGEWCEKQSTLSCKDTSKREVREMSREFRATELDKPRIPHTLSQAARDQWQAQSRVDACNPYSPHYSTSSRPRNQSRRFSLVSLVLGLLEPELLAELVRGHAELEQLLEHCRKVLEKLVLVMSVD